MSLGVTGAHMMPFTVDIHFNVDVMRQVWDNKEVVTQMSVVPSYVQGADDLGGGHG